MTKDLVMFQNDDLRVLVYEEPLKEGSVWKNTKVNIVRGSEDITMTYSDFRKLTTMMKNVVELVDAN